MSNVNWENLLQIEEKWVDKYLTAQMLTREVKTIIRAYTIQFSGTINSYKGLAHALSEIIGKFYHGKEEIKKIGEIRALLNAQKIFGQNSPSNDGKYGELLLFAFVESVLRCPMVAHKIPTSFNDQVKGSDGIFIGKYEYEKGKQHEAILIGESKIWQEYSSALEDSLNSINRFHESIEKSHFNAQEFIVAKKGLVQSNEIDIDTIYNYLSPEKPEHQKCILVHPVFIMYETKKISSIETKAKITQEAEKLIKEYIIQKHKKHIDLLNDKLKLFPELKKIYLDYFILPVKDVDEFRNELYYEIHGVKYDNK